MKTANEARAETAEARKRRSEERMARINKLLTDNDVSGKSTQRLSVVIPIHTLAWRKQMDYVGLK